MVHLKVVHRVPRVVLHAVSPAHAVVCVVVLHTVRRAWDTVATITVTEAEGDAEGAWPQD